MINHNHIQQTNPQHREKKTLTAKILGEDNSDDCKTRKDTK